MKHKYTKTAYMSTFKTTLINLEDILTIKFSLYFIQIENARN